MPFNGEPIAPYLRDPPESRENVDPPLVPGRKLLPLQQLTPEDFERLVYRLARLTGEPDGCRRYGVRGQKQEGIDVFARLPDGKYATYQCKRYADFTAADLRAAVAEFEAGAWRARSESFTVCISGSADNTAVEEEFERLHALLSKEEMPIRLQLWDVEELSVLLGVRDRRDIIVQFFGPEWARHILGADERHTDDLGPRARPLLVSLDWALEPLRSDLDSLRAEAPDVFQLLAEHVGLPPNPELLTAAVRHRPPWLQNAGPDTWPLIARVAQAVGAWEAARKAWEAAACTSEGAGKFLARAAIAAGIEGTPEERDRLLKAARHAAPDDVRLNLELMGEGMPPGEQLRLLEELSPSDSEERALIAGQRAVAHLLQTNVEGAHRALNEVKAESYADSMLAGAVEVSIVVQEGRIATYEGATLDRAALKRAETTCSLLRNRYLEQGRFEESTRMVMLGADAHSLLGNRSSAVRLIRSARQEERRSQEQIEVLAEAAHRTLDERLTLELVAQGERTPTLKLLHAICMEKVGTVSEREAALRELEEIVLLEGKEAPAAAFARLEACLGQRPTTWSETAATFLRSTSFERAAVTVESLFLVQRSGWSDAETVLRPYGDARWAVAARLRTSLHARVPGHIAAEMARKAASLAPGHQLQLDIARGFARGKRWEDARNALLRIVRDPNAPDSVLPLAYDLTLRVLLRELDESDLAVEIYDSWVRRMPGEPRAQSWAPTIENRRSRAM